MGAPRVGLGMAEMREDGGGGSRWHDKEHSVRVPGVGDVENRGRHQIPNVCCELELVGGR